ncbi:MAG: glycosyltransferase [Bacteroidia bacterium]|nr:glycosyltransferase [Bacteroidia bacterium]NNL32848.1 glycosyltransferase [Flavobacteriaceae bacterium]
MNRILIAPLNWGLGHATRCVPIIDTILKNGDEVIIASDGQALLFLQKQYPLLKCFEFPSYDISYSKKGKFLKWKLLKAVPKINKAIKAEHKLTSKLIASEGITGIISDNRLGVYNTNVPSVIITHQLRVFSGWATWISTRIHQNFIKKFDRCWVPDVDTKPNLSGRLGHRKNTSIKVKYLGIVSRMKFKPLPKVYDLMVLLSGPEPQRSLLEQILFEQLKDYQGKILFVKGIVEAEQFIQQRKQFTVINYMIGEALQTALNESDLIISRSGYSTILDLAVLNKKAFFIPTSGQTEQEYLAKKFDEENIAPYCTQEEFDLDQLRRVENYSGFNDFNSKNNIEALLDFFKCE